MAYDEHLASRIRRILATRSPVEKKMFGGLCFMVNGHMTVGVNGDEIMVRVGKDGHAAALAQPHARPMDFTGRPLAGLVYVDADGIARDDDLAAWVRRGLAFVETLPRR